MRCHFWPTDRVRLGKSVAVLMFGTDDLRERANLVKYCGAIIPGSARISRVGESVSLSRTFLKIVSARRRNQHARRVRYPESPSRTCSIFRASNQQRSDKRFK